MMIRSLAAAVLVTGLLAGPGLSLAPAAHAANLASAETLVQERREARQERRREARADNRQGRQDGARRERRQEMRQDRRREAVQERRQERRAERRDDRREQRFERREDRRDTRFDQRADRRDFRQDQRFDRRDHRRGVQRDFRHDRRVTHTNRGYHPAPRAYTPPRRVYSHAPRRDWRYHSRYHDRYARSNFRYDQRFCHSSGDTVVAGALIGAILGGAASDGSGGAVLAGGLLGAGLGSSINDCDRGQYRYAVHSAFSNDRPYYWNNPYSGVRGVVYARDWHNYGGRQCRWGDAEIFLPNGQVAYDRVRMCRDRYGRWEVARRQ